MTRKRTYLVSEVAEIAGVSVRTLHHYDDVGLLVPRGRTEAGYRLYDDDDLLRLQQILLGRELGLSLEEIRHSLDDPSFDRRRALLAQRVELQARARETDAMLRAIDAALEHLDREGAALPEGNIMDFRKIFDGFEPAKIARYDARKKAKLMADAGIVRNKLKIEGAVLSARAYLDAME
jgi:DNA-binding transcriptional MerR regulator